MDLKERTVTIIGAARSGVAAAELVCNLGGKARISDLRPADIVRKAVEESALSADISVESGGHTRDFVTRSDLVVASPGVRFDAEPLAWARMAGLPVWGEIELASRFCRKPIVAVTGSNGKTTTSTLIAEVLQAAGRNVCLCGNVGLPFSRQVLNSEIDIFVVEVSSFQLELTVTFHPHVALLLNFSQNHLDRHKDLQEYLDAKKRIFHNQTAQDFAVLNACDETVRQLAGEVKAQVVFFNQKDEMANPNHLAAEAAVRVLGVADETAQKVFAVFNGVEHRLEKVRIINGVEYINDSKSTTVEAGRWALERMDKPLVMIAGGSDKHMNYAPLRELMRRKVRVMLAIGEIRNQLKETFGDVISVEVVSGGLDEALIRARSLARGGECVLLSPMTASFDMFKDFEHRGHVFKEIVRSLF